MTAIDLAPKFPPFAKRSSASHALSPSNLGDKTTATPGTILAEMIASDLHFLATITSTPIDYVAGRAPLGEHLLGDQATETQADFVFDRVSHGRSTPRG
jgi:hypothetical protein